MMVKMMDRVCYFSSSSAIDPVSFDAVLRIASMEKTSVRGRLCEWGTCGQIRYAFLQGAAH